LETTLTNHNSIQEEIKSSLKSGNACYHSAQNLLPSSLLSKSIKSKIYRIIILPVVLYECETRSPTLREECRLRVFENRVLWSIIGSKRYDFWVYMLKRMFCVTVFHIYGSVAVHNKDCE
jgi:hypothetical protein